MEVLTVLLGGAALALLCLLSWARLRPPTFDVAAFLRGDVPVAPKSSPVRKMAVVLNPMAGGRGQPLKAWTRAKVLLDRHGAHIEYTCITTRAAGHAKRWAAEELTVEFDTILCIGGDGTLFEVVNGLFSRTDFREVVSKLALAVIPAGSGNGLARSLGIKPDELEKAVAVAIRGKRSPLNVMKVKQGDKVFHCFNFISYGILADIDFESEAYRFLGSTRFYIAGLLRILFKRAYPVKVKMVADKEYSSFCDSGVKCEGDEEVSMEMTGILVCNSPYITSDFQAAPKAVMDDGFLDVVYCSGSMPRHQLLQMLIRGESGTHVSLPSLRYVKVRSLHIEAAGPCRPAFGRERARSGLFDVDGEPFPSDVALEISLHDANLQICR